MEPEGHLEIKKQIMMNREVWGEDFFLGGGNVKIRARRFRVTKTDFG